MWNIGIHSPNMLDPVDWKKNIENCKIDCWMDMKNIEIQ